jgi:hypothetical protein
VQGVIMIMNIEETLMVVVHLIVGINQHNNLNLQFLPGLQVLIEEGADEDEAVVVVVGIIIIREAIIDFVIDLKILNKKNYIFVLHKYITTFKLLFMQLIRIFKHI